MKNLYAYSFEALKEEIAFVKEKPYRAIQLFHWLYRMDTTDFTLMTNLALPLRQFLEENYVINKPKIFTSQIAEDHTIKLLLELKDGLKVEAALLRYRYGNALCVSTQVGCNMGCNFCASGLLKKQRNLEVDEMVGQLLVMNDFLKSQGEDEKVTHVVLMGTGEPFDNYENVLSFVRLINHPHGLAIGARKITISTCGMVPQIYQFADEGLQVNLAISLHATNDEVRSKLMPINDAYPLSDLKKAIEYYLLKTNRRVTFEYLLLDSVNDSIRDAHDLANYVGDLEAYVNLIPYNEVLEKHYRRSKEQNIKAFQKVLTMRNVTSTLRKEFGHDIDAACGQLRAKQDGAT